MGVVIGIVSNGKCIGTLQQKIIYENNKCILRKVAPNIANKLIGIIENESNDIERRTSFVETTVTEILAGADYKNCESINDICEVYSKSLINRLEL